MRDKDRNVESEEKKKKENRKRKKRKQRSFHEPMAASRWRWTSVTRKREGVSRKRDRAPVFLVIARASQRRSKVAGRSPTRRVRCMIHPLIALTIHRRVLPSAYHWPNWTPSLVRLSRVVERERSNCTFTTESDETSYDCFELFISFFVSLLKTGGKKKVFPSRKEKTRKKTDDLKPVVKILIISHRRVCFTPRIISCVILEIKW